MAPPAQRAAATATDAASTLPVAMSAISMAVTVASHPRTATSSLMVLRLARRSLFVFAVEMAPRHVGHACPHLAVRPSTRLAAKRRYLARRLRRVRRRISVGTLAAAREGAFLVVYAHVGGAEPHYQRRSRKRRVRLYSLR